MVKRQKIISRRTPRQQPITKHIDRNLRRSTVIKTIIAGSDKMPLYTAAEKRIKIALVQTGSWGDSINSTLMFAPLRAKYPNCLIDVYTSTFYASAFQNNPFINKLIKYTATDKQSALHLTVTIPPEIDQRGYDHIFAPHPMFNPGNWTSIKHPELGTNLICAWVRALEHADIEYTLPLETSLRLTETEIQRVARFCKNIDNMKQMRNVLMEVHGESGQTFWDHHWTMDTCRHLLSDPKTNIFISRRHNSSDVHELQAHAPGRVFFVGDLSIRECAELFNRCQIFFSVSSGLSNACCTSWCKKPDGIKLKWVETINSPTVISAPLGANNKIFWYQNNREAFVEMLKSNKI